MIVATNILLVIALLICLYTDIKERKIYNKVTFSLILLGLILNLINNGPGGALFSLKGLLLALGIMFIPFALGGIGAGDVKLIMAIGAVKGPAFVLLSTVVTFLVGGLIALALLIRRKMLLSTIKHILGNIGILFMGKFKSNYIEGLNHSSKVTFPYGIAIFIGTIATLMVV